VPVKRLNEQVAAQHYDGMFDALNRDERLLVRHLRSFAFKIAAADP
jgi:hypothetical protein